MIRFLLILFYLCCAILNLNAQEFYLRWTNPINLSNLNSTKADFAPIWNRFDNRLYFSSTRDALSKFYFADRIDSMSFSGPSMIDGEINNTKNHVSFLSFVAEDRVYLSTFRMNAKRPFFNIFESILTAEGWSAPLTIENLIKEFNCLHPAVSPNGQMLVIASDMHSKQQRTNLYISYRGANGQWGALQELSVLNTEGSEITPYFASDDTLFFASDGQFGPGGFDLFYSILRNGSWSKPNPLNELNTAYDESDFTFIDKGIAVFASNRPGSRGDYDLYLTRSFLTEYKVPPERFLEISIATQILNIKTSEYFNYDYVPLVNTILSDISEDELNTILSAEQNYIFTGSFSDNYRISLMEIGRRLSRNRDAKLIVHYNILETEDKNIKLPDGRSLGDRVKDYFADVWGVESNSITLSGHLLRISGAELSVFPLVYLDSDNPIIFRQAEYGDRKIDIDPPFSDVFVNIKPADNMEEWSAHLLTKDKQNVFSYKSKLAQDNFTIKLSDYSDLIRNSDSLTIAVSAVNKFADTMSKELYFDLTHSVSKKRQFLNINNNRYEQLYFLIPDENLDESVNHIRDMLDLLAQSAEFGRSIKIEYYSVNAQKRAFALNNLLKKVINIDMLKYDVEQKPWTSDLPFPRKFAPYVLKILLERY